MNWIDAVKGIAPMVGTALGGPLGGAAAAFLADKLGVKEKTLEAVSAVLSSGKMTPDQLVQVREAEIEFEKFCKQNNIDVARVHLENTKDARVMQTQTRSYYPATLSTIITIGFFSILGWMLYDDKIANSEPILIMLGALGAAFAAVVNFWLGSSIGSMQKTEAMARK